MPQRDPAQRHRSLGPVGGQLVVAGQALQQQQVSGVAEVRHQRTEQLAGHLLDVERVTDPGEGVVEHLLAHDRGVDEPLGLRHGNAEQGQRGQAGAARAHRVHRHHRLGRTPVAGVHGQHRGALAVGPDRLQQAGDRGGTVRRPGRQVAELGAEQLVGLACEDARRGAVVLDDPPVVIDAENEGAHRRGERVRHALGADAVRERPLGTAYAGLLGIGVHGTGGRGPIRGAGAVAAFAATADSATSVFRGPRGRGTLSRSTALGAACPESAALRRHARCHVLSPDGITGCALVNYELRTSR